MSRIPSASEMSKSNKPSSSGRMHKQIRMQQPIHGNRIRKHQNAEQVVDLFIVDFKVAHVNLNLGGARSSIMVACSFGLLTYVNISSNVQRMVIHSLLGVGLI